MANKQLNAKVRLDVSQAEQAIRKLESRIRALNTTATKATRWETSNAQLQHQVRLMGEGDRAAQRLAASAERAKRAEYQRWWQTQLTNREYQKTHRYLGTIPSKLKMWANSQKNVTGTITTTNRALASLGSKLKGIAATYLGIMGTRAVLDTTDVLIGAQNRLNYVSATQLGEAGYNNDGTYSNKTLNMTSDAMDKIYVASQNARTSYHGMMANVSKTMALAGNAFDNNINNAIRFQEIMAEAYAVGGASAAEMSSSMYQMTQALGAGILAGDELRSVREGAPLAYQAIEEFAQGVLNTEESLKDLASQGKITSDMVVAAIMNSGSEMDKAFAQTSQTFGQTLEQIKNVAMSAFQPVMEELKDALNSAVDNGMIQKFEGFFTAIAKFVLILFKIISNVVNWIAENWSWLKHLLIAGLIALGVYLAYTAIVAVNAAIIMIVEFIIVNYQLVTIIATIAALIFIFYLWKTGAIDTCQAITYALLVVAGALLLIGIITTSIPMIVAAAVLIILALLLMFFEEICGFGWAILTFIGNIIQTILNIVVTVISTILALAMNFVTAICNGVAGIVSVVKAVGSNILTAFSNAWNGAKAAFWDFIADCLEGLKKLEPAINAIAKVFGKEGFTLSGLVESVRGKADAARGNIKEYVDVGDAWKSGTQTFDYIDLGALVNDRMQTFGTGISDWSWDEAYNTGYDFGAGIKDKINDFGSKFQSTGSKEGSILDRIGNALGLDFSGMGKFPTEGTDGSLSSYDPKDLLDAAKDIGDKTGSIADSMDLAEEDLEYLRKLADLEWKKEYTTATIQIDMSNYNTVNGDGDLDGIVTKLADKLYEEMDYLANGVYA